jgi:hypothetical protein
MSVKVKRKVKLPLCLTNLTLHNKDVWESGRINPRILHLSTTWIAVAEFPPLPIG